MQKKLHACLVTVSVQMIDATSVETRRTTHNPMHLCCGYGNMTVSDLLKGANKAQKEHSRQEISLHLPYNLSQVRTQRGTSHLGP